MATNTDHRKSSARPGLNRSRSHTIPSGTSPVEPLPPASARPNYGRSHSYISPIERKPRAAQTLPTEKTSRLHFPGTSHLHSGEHRHILRHRHTQSHNENHGRPSRVNENEALPHLVAGINTERERRAATNDQWYSRANELMRLASAMGPRGGPLPLSESGYATVDPVRLAAARARAISSAQVPQVPRSKPKSPIEVALERADVRKKTTRMSLTQHDIDAMRRAQENANIELTDRLSALTRAGGDITRRLDYTFYSLLEKLGSLVSTIQSFQSLSTQSKHLIDNFSHEAENLDEDIQRRVKAFEKGFKDREARISDLETRASTASTKAVDLGRRLENARIIVESWEARESAARRKWGRLWGAVWWIFVVFTVVLLSTIVAREWWFRGDPVNTALRVPRGGSRNATLRIDAKVLRTVQVPADVREVLVGIEERRARIAKPIWSRVVDALGRDELAVAEEPQNDDKRLRLLDEL